MEGYRTAPVAAKQPRGIDRTAASVPLTERGHRTSVTVRASDDRAPEGKMAHCYVALRTGHVAGRLVSELRLLIMIGALALLTPLPIQAQGLSQVFQQVNPSVVVVRAKGRDLVARAGESVLVKYNEVGSGVLVSADG